MSSVPGLPPAGGGACLGRHLRERGSREVSGPWPVQRLPSWLQSCVGSDGRGNGALAPSAWVAGGGWCARWVLWLALRTGSVALDVPRAHTRERGRESECGLVGLELVLRPGCQAFLELESGCSGKRRWGQQPATLPRPPGVVSLGGGGARHVSRVEWVFPGQGYSRWLWGLSSPIVRQVQMAYVWVGVGRGRGRVCPFARFPL